MNFISPQRLAFVATCICASTLTSFADASTLKIPGASPAAAAGEPIRSMRLKYLGRGASNIIINGTGNAGSMLMFDGESRPTATLELATSTFNCLIAFKTYADAAETLRSISDDSTVECITSSTQMVRTHWVVDEFSVSRSK